jgi:hypothetical protein
LAAFASAWDRLDYKAAQNVIIPAAPRPSPWDVFVPPPDVRAWVGVLAQPLPAEHLKRANRLRLLLADLLANGERRIRHQQYEDAIIRAYRVLELIGQIRLFDHGLDSSALPPDHPHVKPFAHELPSNREGQRTAGRVQAALILKRLRDPLAKPLLDLGERGMLKASDRNLSVWIHGFEAVSGSNPEPLRELYQRLEELIVQDGAVEATRGLGNARWLDFGRARA